MPEIYYRPANWRTMGGALAALEMTSRGGFRNVILSNHAPELPGLVDALGLARHVERTITSALLGVEKPDPKMFRAALDLAQAAPNSWMIGDGPVTDLEGAQAVGMRAVLVHRTLGDTPPRTPTSAAAEVIQAQPQPPSVGALGRTKEVLGGFS